MGYGQYVLLLAFGILIDLPSRLSVMVIVERHMQVLPKVLPLTPLLIIPLTALFI